MAKTILEDIGAFLAQQNAWTARLPFDIRATNEKLQDTILIIKEQMDNSDKLLDEQKYIVELDLDKLRREYDLFVINYNKQLEIIKQFITTHKGEFLIKNVEVLTRFEKEHAWLVKELTGAAEDRVDIRQELGYEITKRRSQDTLLNTKIESEILDRIQKQQLLKTDLEKAINATNLTVSELQNIINQEILDRTNNYASLLQSIAQEANARNLADTNITQSLELINDNLNTEAATRFANINTINDSIQTFYTTVMNNLTEFESRRISDLAILSSRDNLEEDESKKRDYNNLKEVRDILSEAPLKTFSNGVYDWDQLDVSKGNADTNGTATSAGSVKHGLLANVIRKLNLLSKFVQGSTSDVYDTNPSTSATASNLTVGLDYWQGSNFKTKLDNMTYTDPILGSSYSVIKHNIPSGTTPATAHLAKDYDRITLGGSAVTIDKTVGINTLTVGGDITKLYGTGILELKINTAEGIMKAYKFEGIATKALYADLAERYEADLVYPIGTVLGIGGDKEVTLYTEETPLAGVVSEKPGFRMNDKLSETDEDYNNYDSYNPFIALKGRIPVLIIGTAKKGDYILAYTNGKGIAINKKDLPQNYNLTLIGIALSNSKDGQVEVKV
jgi:hypothetical protein